MKKNLVILGLVFCFLVCCSGPVWAQDIYQLQLPDSATEADLNSGEKQPWLAAGMSLLVPGTGQMYVQENVWPGLLITGGMAVGVGAFFFVDAQRAASIKTRTVRNQEMRLADAHWEALLLILQIALPSIWLWNFGDAYRQAETHNRQLLGPDPTETSILKESALSITLWQF